MLELLHERANALQAVYELTMRLSEALDQLEDTADIEKAIALLDERKTLIDRANEVGSRVKACEPYQATPEILREKKMTAAIIENIQRLESENQLKASKSLDALMKDIRGVKNGMRSVKAYGGLYDDDGNSVFVDTTR